MKGLGIYIMLIVIGIFMILEDKEKNPNITNQTEIVEQR